MSPRSKSSQKCHDKIIRRLFNDLCIKGYEGVLASHIELPEERKPEEIYNETSKMTFCPDISAEKDGILYFFEVETEDSIDLTLTKTEFECFAKYAKKCGGYFYIVVPEEIKEKATAILNAIDDKDGRKTFILSV